MVFMKIIFFGSDPWMSPGVLASLIKAGHEILLVVTKNNLQNLIRSDLTGIPGSFKGRTLQTNTAEDITKTNLLRRLLALRQAQGKLQGVSFTEPACGGAKPDAIVLAAFGPPFLAEDILDWPKYGCLNVHASLLPRWRGASPVFAAINSGDQETGVTIMKISKEVDRGPILGQRRIKIRQPSASLDPSSRTPRDDDNHNFDNRESLTKRLGMLGGELIVETLKNLESDQIKLVDQPEKSPTPYTHRLTKKDGEINWSKSPAETERFIRAVSPWPGAWTEFVIASPAVGRGNLQPMTLKILKAHLKTDCHGSPSDPRNDVELAIDEVQLPGKNPVSWKQFMAGHPNAKLF